MARKKKTREQKIIADLRKKLEVNQVETRPIEKKERIEIPQQQPKFQYLQKDDQYAPHLIKDLKKTAVVTFSILFFQALLYALLVNNILNIPRLNY